MPKTILIVEDQEDVRMMMSAVIRRFGYDVLEAADGFGAVIQAVEAMPDLILMDMAMPVVDGLRATKAIREHNELDKVPIILLTAFRTFYETNALQAGCNRVIRKPVSVDHLKVLLAEYL
jgi:two-component system phosphate regulon response regulator PhoB/two-component system alkaline phosphatase synthesis response regulator PhoP